MHLSLPTLVVFAVPSKLMVSYEDNTSAYLASSDVHGAQFVLVHATAVVTLVQSVCRTRDPCHSL